MKRIDFWHEFSTEPLKKFVGRIVLAGEEYTISFRSDGLITLYSRDIPLQTLIKVLNDIMNNIISKHFGDVYHQTKFTLFEKDDKNEPE